MESTSALDVSVPPAFVMSAQEQAFLDSVVSPRIGARVAKIRGVMKDDLTQAFAAVRIELNHEVVKESGVSFTWQILDAGG